MEGLPCDIWELSKFSSYNLNTYTWLFLLLWNAYFDRLVVTHILDSSSPKYSLENTVAEEKALAERRLYAQSSYDGH